MCTCVDWSSRAAPAGAGSGAPSGEAGHVSLLVSHSDGQLCVVDVPTGTKYPPPPPKKSLAAAASPAKPSTAAYNHHPRPGQRPRHIPPTSAPASITAALV